MGTHSQGPPTGALTAEETAAALHAAQAGAAAAATATASQQPSSGTGGTGAGTAGAAPEGGPHYDPLDGHPPYVSWEERREQSERKPPRKSSGHAYCVKFFLVDTAGVEYLAAVGEDQGDAHYLYEQRPGFPFLRANNKAEVRAWLETLIARSKDRAGVHGHVVQDVVPQDPNQIRLPKFVGHSQEKKELADGRHRIEWYLLDEADDSHLAVVGEEKETRDGHYLYRTQGIFDQALPLSVGNQREVERWIDVMVFHGGVAPTPPFPRADSLGGAAAASAGRAASDASALRAGGGSRAGARPHAAAAAHSHQRGGGGGGGAGQKHDLLKQATTNAKKQRTQQGRQDPDTEAREAVAGELQRWGQEEAQRREACKRQALAYATDPLAGKEAAAAKRCLAVLRQAADKPSFLPGGGGGGGGGGHGSATRGGSGGSHQQQANLVEALAALRELAHMYAPLSLVAMPELKECLARLQAHPHAEVSRLARAVLEQWLRVAVAQAQVLTDPRYVQDPRSVLEAVLSSRDAADPLVSAITHRTLQPPPKGGGAQAAGRPPAGPGHAPRGGSRLGGAGAPAGAAAAADTPAGLLAGRPSEASLGGLVATAELGGSLPLPMDLDGGGGATVERRRLDLDALDSPAAVLTTAGMRRQGQALSASSSGEEEEEEAAAAAAARATAGAASDPSSAPPSSSLADMMVPGDSQALGVPRHRGGGGSGVNLAWAASVDLIDAPISAVESEQAEMLPASGDGQGGA